MLFSRTPSASPTGDFSHLERGARYFDSACQTPRPRCVIDAETEYYRDYNACGGRVKYRWGERVDAAVAEARSLLLRATGKDARDYAVAFTLNTTYGINLVLHQLAKDACERVVTSEIEHNSVMVPAMAFSKRRNVPLSILPRADDGALAYGKNDLSRAAVIANVVSNIDGRRLANASALATDVHAAGGLLLLDAAQGFAHGRGSLADIDFDAAFGSGHKTYAPSLGFVVIRRSLLSSLDPFLLGGGTVSDVSESSYSILAGDEAHAALEPGLQNWGGIVGLAEALRWLGKHDERTEEALSSRLWEGLRSMPRVRPVNVSASPVVSFHVEGLDSHKLALLLSEQKIMCRSGYFCCHRYLLHQRALPPLLRVSMGLHNTEDDVDALLAAIRSILSAF